MTWPSSPCHPASSIMIDGRFEGSLTEKGTHNGTENESMKRGRSRVTIDILPDVVLLGIFDFYLGEEDRWEASWEVLVHVCRTWRHVVFGSPRRLGVMLYFTHNTPVEWMLDVWPQFPIIIKAYWAAGDIAAALVHNDRIYQLDLVSFPKSQLIEVFEAMQRPFPTLKYLRIRPEYDEVPVSLVPASFLGGFAPCLQTFHLERISFSGLPNVLLSATHLVTLSLLEIPPIGYISPEALVNCLSVLTRLDNLDFQFSHWFPELDNTCPPPRTRTLLPVLTRLCFHVTSEYLEGLMARIDAPLLDKLLIFLHNDSISESSDTTQIADFISRTPNFKAYDHVQVVFSTVDASIVFLEALIRLELIISPSGGLDEGLLCMVQICTSLFPRALIATLDRLYLLADPSLRGEPVDDIEITQWLNLLRPFTGLKHLFMHSEFWPNILLALQQLVGERVTEVLPALQTLFLETPEREDDDVQDSIEWFVAARCRASHPIDFCPWPADVAYY